MGRRFPKKIFSKKHKGSLGVYDWGFFRNLGPRGALIPGTPSYATGQGKQGKAGHDGTAGNGRTYRSGHDRAEHTDQDRTGRTDRA